MKFKDEKLNKILDKLKDFSLLDPTSEFQKNSKIRLLNSLSVKEIPIKNGFGFNFVNRSIAWKAVLTVIIVILLSAGSCYASQNSLPGDTFYPVKRAFEKISYNLTINPEIKLQLKIESAKSRLFETERLVARNKNHIDLIYSTLLDYNKTMTVIQKISSRGSLDSFQTEIANIENIYNQIIDNIPAEIKTQLQSQQREQDRHLQTQVQKQLNQQIETGDILGNNKEYNKSSDQDHEIEPQYQKKIDDNINKGSEEIQFDTNKSGQIQVNKP
jgi:uncharacterized protein DUF5667